MNDVTKRKHYKTERTPYLCLLLVSLAIIVSSFLINESNRWFTIIVGFGCSGIASVILAWLLDVASCKRKEEANSEFLNHLFGSFDSTIQYELNCILESCAQKDHSVDIEREYSLHEMGELLKQADGSLPAWEKSYHNFGLAYASVDTSFE